MFRTQPLMPLGRAKKNLQNYMLSGDEYRKLVSVLDDLRYRYMDDIIIEWGDPTQHLVDYGNGALVGGAIIGINAYGYLTVSPYLPLYIGNIKKYNLYTYYTSSYDEIISTQIVRDLARYITTIDQMDISDSNSKIPTNYLDESIYLDWLDEKAKFENPLDYILKH